MDWLCRVRSRNDYRDGKNGLIIIFRLENKFDSGETGKRHKERGFGFPSPPLAPPRLHPL